MKDGEEVPWPVGHGSGDLPPPPCQAEKNTASQDQAGKASTRDGGGDSGGGNTENGVKRFGRLRPRLQGTGCCYRQDVTHQAAGNS